MNQDTNRFVRVFCYSAILLFTSLTLAKPPPSIVVVDDGIQCRFDDVARVVAFSDIHGDMHALLRILTSKQTMLLDENGNWIGKNTKVIINGDLIDGDPNSEEILKYIYGTLKTKIEAGGGSLDVIIGNHELMAAGGNDKHMTRAEERLFATAMGDAHTKDFKQIDDVVRHGFRSADGVYAEQMRIENFYIVANRTLFVHAGLTKQMLEMARAGMKPEAINIIGRQYLRYFQGMGPKPPDWFDWIVDLEKKQDKDTRSEDFTTVTGPVSDRSFKIKKGFSKQPKNGPSKKELAELLAWFDADSVVIGHTPTPDGKIWLEHPYYGDKVRSIDTHRAEIFGGNVTALEINLVKNQNEFVVLDIDRKPKSKKIIALDKKIKKEQNLSSGECENLF